MERIEKDCYLISADHIAKLMKIHYNLDVQPRELIDYSKTFEGWVLIEKSQLEGYKPKFQRYLERLLEDKYINEGYYLLNGINDDESY